MLTITLPIKREGETVVGGIIFTDGVARVQALSPHKRAFLEALGARIKEPRQKPAQRVSQED